MCVCQWGSNKKNNLIHPTWMRKLVPGTQLYQASPFLASCFKLSAVKRSIWWCYAFTACNRWSSTSQGRNFNLRITLDSSFKVFQQGAVGWNDYFSLKTILQTCSRSWLRMSVVHKVQMKYEGVSFSVKVSAVRLQAVPGCQSSTNIWVCVRFSAWHVKAFFVVLLSSCSINLHSMSNHRTLEQSLAPDARPKPRPDLRFQSDNPSVLCLCFLPQEQTVFRRL